MSKKQKGRLQNLLRVRGNKFAMGNIGIMACESGRINSKQMEAARIAIQRRVRKYPKIIRRHVNIPVTRKPLEMRMGQGKGSISHWIFRVKPGQILFEIKRKNLKRRRIALHYAQKKLSIISKII